MKKLFLLLIIIALFVSCEAQVQMRSEPSRAQTIDESESITGNPNVYRHMFQGLGLGDDLSLLYISSRDENREVFYTLINNETNEIIWVLLSNRYYNRAPDISIVRTGVRANAETLRQAD